MTFVVAGGPIRQRGWAVQHHVAALLRNEVDAFVYVCGDSTDGTTEWLMGALSSTGCPYTIVYRPDPLDAGYSRSGPLRYSMTNLASARQTWVDVCLAAFPRLTHLWSCDSDIVPDDGVLSILLEQNGAMVGANVAMNSSLSARNVMSARSDIGPRRDPDGELHLVPTRVLWTGACILYDRFVFDPEADGGYGCRYDNDDPSRMEEMGIVTKLDSTGAPIWWCPQARTHHLQPDGAYWR